MKKLTLLLILLIGSLSYGQVILYQNAPDRQKITEFEKRNDSLVISLENSGTNKVYLGDLRTDISGKANINSPTFTGNVVVPTATISDAAVNLGQMMDSLATIEVSASGIVSQYMDADKTLIQSDFGKYIYTDESIELTIDNTPVVSSKIGLKVIDIDSTITVIPDGVTFQGDGQDISEGFIVDSLNLATVFKLASNLYSVDGVYKPYVPPPPPANLYTLANAANPDNEVNATTGTGGTARATWSSVSSSPSPQHGTHSLKLARTTGSVSSQGRIYLEGLEIGQSYNVKYYVYESASTVNATVYFQSEGGWSVTATTAVTTTGEWVEHSVNVTPSSTTPDILLYLGSTVQDGEWVAIDNIRITENED